MTKFHLSKIPSLTTDIDRLEVHSFEMNVYLVKLCVDGKEGFVYENDSPKRFYSSQQIRHVFEHCKVLSSYMVHDTPYDEMIGNPQKASVSMALPFSMSLPY
ncbi:DUF6482 family protein [Agaribacter flavus]|uniref:DUF6482 family protein n=1 Tax=Agaribacter flavus TaxID=1902781 RepID=A0ABV7FTE2_9ALTE